MLQETNFTPTFSSTFLQDMQSRGMINQCTDIVRLDNKLAAGPITAYVGFDATADSLHAGHLLSLITMRRLARLGHRVIALLGGATTLIGDPSFRTESRPLLTETSVAENIAGIRRNIETVFGEHADNLMIVDNKDWLSEVGLISFMRDVGKHFTLARMLSMESVKRRMDDGLTMLEFSYMMLQSADFMELARRHDCVLQMGGSDQWGNIVNGIDLARRSDDKELLGLTTPLLTTANGQKMGKTANGAVWLSAEKLSPFDFWQFWRNVDDADVGRFLLMLTDFNTAEIEILCADRVNDAKVALANAVTGIVHGEKEAERCNQRAVQLFNGERPQDVTFVQSHDGVRGLVSIMVELGFCNTNNEARRLVDGNAVKIDGGPVKDWKIQFSSGDAFLITSGKRKRNFVKIT